MNLRKIIDSATLGGIIGGALGVLLDGTLLMLPGGREIIISKAIADVAFAATTVATTTVSASAVGTLLGASAGVASEGKNCVESNRIKPAR